MPTDIPKLRKREVDTHKNDYGRIFVLAGSLGMVGAALLTCEAALRAGAGYVKLGMPWQLAALANSNPYTICVVSEGFPATEAQTLGIIGKSKILTALEGFEVAAIGPGLSTNSQTQELVCQILPELKSALVLDADGLNAVARHRDVVAKIPREHGLPVFTPHPGEFQRLTGAAEKISQRERESACKSYAREHQVVCVLKGHRTVVSDGARCYINQTGNPGMATAGTGDVLTGVISALRGQGYDSYEAAVLGVYLHGLAGDMAADDMGEWGLTAHDILNRLPRVFRRHWQEGLKDNGNGENSPG